MPSRYLKPHEAMREAVGMLDRYAEILKLLQASSHPGIPLPPELQPVDLAKGVDHVRYVRSVLDHLAEQGPEALMRQQLARRIEEIETRLDFLEDRPEE